MSMSDFKWEEETALTKATKRISNSDKIVFAAGGGKGTGKTGFAMGLPGRIYTICYDRKAKRVWAALYKNNKRITVLDGAKYIKHRNIEEYTNECERTYRYTMFMLEEMEKRGDADWIHFDASDTLTKIIEMKMRFKEHLSAFQGVQNRGLWNLRNFDLRTLHNVALKVARYGIVYTTYREIVTVEDDGVEKTVYLPKWSDVIKEETDIYVEPKQDITRDKNGKLKATFRIVVVNSKIPTILKTGEEINLTDTDITSWLKLHGRFDYFRMLERPVKTMKHKKHKKKFL